MKIDLNADMGESFGDWRMGNDGALLDIVTSANIACGFHAGDPDVMANTMRLAVKKGVGLGAHPGFADLQGFGRRRIALPESSLRNLVQYQLGAAQAMAKAAGGQLRHFKLHGALANIASEDIDLARTCYAAALEIDPKLVIVVIAATAQQQAAQALGCHWAGEIFADRAYNNDATLRGRHLDGAVITDPEEAAARVVKMVQSGMIISHSGHQIPARIDTVCLHGDGKTALATARTVRTALEAAGMQLSGISAKP